MSIMVDNTYGSSDVCVMGAPYREVNSKVATVTGLLLSNEKVQ